MESTGVENRMKRKILMLIATLCIILTFSPTFLCSQMVVGGSAFHAEIGIGERTKPQLELNGNTRTIRERHLVFGTANLMRSERAFRFQGMFTRQTFIIQSAVGNRMINIVGSFNRYDEATQTIYGNWRGFIVGYGWTTGWIEASLS